MNKERRRKLKQALAVIKVAAPMVEDVLEDEREAMESTPEGLNQTTNYETSVEAVANLEKANTGLEEVIEALGEIIGE
jgi:hypothetical protein